MGEVEIEEEEMGPIKMDETGNFEVDEMESDEEDWRPVELDEANEDFEVITLENVDDDFDVVELGETDEGVEVKVFLDVDDCADNDFDSLELDRPEDLPAVAEFNRPDENFDIAEVDELEDGDDPTVMDFVPDILPDEEGLVGLPEAVGLLDVMKPEEVTLKLEEIYEVCETLFRDKPSETLRTGARAANANLA